MLKRRDYQRKNFFNPFFPKNRKKKRGGLKVYFILVAIFTISLFFFNNGSYFKIKNIMVKGNETISQSEIIDLIGQQLRQKRFLIFSQDNIFFFSSRQAKKIMNDVYSFEYLKIKKRFFNSIIVEVKEKTPAVVWVLGSKKYYLDSAGMVTKELVTNNLIIEPGKEGTEVVRVGATKENYPLVYDESNQKLTVGQEAVDKNFINFISQLEEILKNNVDFEVLHYITPNPLSEQLTMVTTEGWQAHFKTTDSAQAQINRLLLILQQKVGERANLQYIDLRFGDKVFYK